jgi:hypothetical protein
MRKLITIGILATIFAGLFSTVALAKQEKDYFPEFEVGTYLRASDCSEEELKTCKKAPENCKCKSFQKMEYFNQEDGSEISPVMEVFLRIIDMLVTVVGSVSVLIFVIGGLILATASGNEQQLQKGKEIFKYAILGLLVTFLSFIVVTFVQSILT